MTKKIIIKVQSGLNNKLLPLLSLLSIADKYNYEIMCFWSNICMGLIKIKEGFHFLDFFEPIDKIQFIDENDFNKLQKSNNLIIHTVNGHNIESYRSASLIDNTLKSHIFHNICHIISLKDDNVINKYIPTRKKQVNTCEFTEEFRKYLNKLKPKKNILEKISSVVNSFNGKILGIHIRTTDTINRKDKTETYHDKLCGLRTGGFSNVDYFTAIKYIEKFLKNNQEWKIYLSVDCHIIEKLFTNKFKNKILKLEEPFGETYESKFDMNSHNGIKNGICEMYILSKCNKIVGTPSSSFSLMAWLLSSHDNLDYWYIK